LVGDDYIEYNIDGISVCRRHLQVVKEYFDSIGLDFKTTLCLKKNMSEYVMGSKARVFTKFSQEWVRIHGNTPLNELKTDTYIGEKTPQNDQKT